VSDRRKDDMAEKPDLDWHHLETVACILDAIAAVESRTPYGIVACEDALVALTLGFSLGLTPDRVAALHRQAVEESAK
jgi:hypothetical protein